MGNDLRTYLVESKKLVDEFEKTVFNLAKYYTETCSNCSLCSRVCPVYRVTKDPKLSPLERLRTALRILSGEPPSSKEMQILYSCLLCGLCTKACPYGYNLWLPVLMARRKLALKGLVPQGLFEVIKNSLKYGHSFTHDRERVLKWVYEAKAPIDTSSKILYVPSPLENLMFPPKLVTKANLLRILGIDYTLSSSIIDLGGNVGIDSSRIDIGVAMAWMAYEKAEDLGAKFLMTSECGSDVKLVHVVLPMFSKELGIRVNSLIHIYDLISSKEIKIESKDNEILFTSCNFCRFTKKCPINFLRSAIPKDRMPYTSCCGGGGGYTINREPWALRIRRTIASSRIRSYGNRVKKVVVPCIKCYVTHKEASLLNKLNIKISLVTEEIYRTLKLYIKNKI